jgi:hypothetical protein
MDLNLSNEVPVYAPTSRMKGTSFIREESKELRSHFSK